MHRCRGRSHQCTFFHQHVYSPVGLFLRGSNIFSCETCRLPYDVRCHNSRFLFCVYCERELLVLWPRRVRRRSSKDQYRTRSHHSRESEKKEHKGRKNFAWILMFSTPFFYYYYCGFSCLSSCGGGWSHFIMYSIKAESIRYAISLSWRNEGLILKIPPNYNIHWSCPSRCLTVNEDLFLIHHLSFITHWCDESEANTFETKESWT
jgi:hypothetical protein